MTFDMNYFDYRKGCDSILYSYIFKKNFQICKNDPSITRFLGNITVSK